jgi:hypothetical protein
MTELAPACHFLRLGLSIRPRGVGITKAPTDVIRRGDQDVGPRWFSMQLLQAGFIVNWDHYGMTCGIESLVIVELE